MRLLLLALLLLAPAATAAAAEDAEARVCTIWTHGYGSCQGGDGRLYAACVEANPLAHACVYEHH